MKPSSRFILFNRLTREYTNVWSSFYHNRPSLRIQATIFCIIRNVEDEEYHGNYWFFNPCALTVSYSLLLRIAGSNVTRYTYKTQGNLRMSIKMQHDKNLHVQLLHCTLRLMVARITSRLQIISSDGISSLAL